ncbi:MAG: hypothetical protein OXT09_20740, partial [Myxococcales bacterium]|nr:hypothetical protein [Myxococcales bacterium]
LDVALLRLRLALRARSLLNEPRRFEFIEELSRQEWVRRYHVTRHEGRVAAPGGAFILARWPIVDLQFTWDIEKSPMAARGSFPGEPSRRLDRILVRLPGYQPSDVSVLGDEPVGKNGVFPSDHFGLAARLVQHD